MLQAFVSLGRNSSCFSKLTSIRLTGAYQCIQAGCCEHLCVEFSLCGQCIADHRHYAHIMFERCHEVHTCCHLGMPFGAVASVHAWHRIGAKFAMVQTLFAIVFLCPRGGCLLKALGRRLLRLVLLHYVDDYIGADRAASAEVAKDTFARLVRACLGESAISPGKLSHGNPLTILGVDIELSMHGATFWPSQDKVEKWLAQILEALDKQVQQSRHVRQHWCMLRCFGHDRRYLAEKHQSSLASCNGQRRALSKASAAP